MFIKMPIRKRRDFFKNNYKTQTISLVSKSFKLISFITIWVQWTRFRKKWCGENMEIEFNELGFHVQKPSSLNSFSMNSAPTGLLQNGLDQSVRLLANEFIELSSHGFAWSDRCLVQKIVGCVCRRLCTISFKTVLKQTRGSWVHGKRVQWTRFLYVEVGHVCGLNCHKPKSSSIRKPNSPRNIIPSIADL